MSHEERFGRAWILATVTLLVACGDVGPGRTGAQTPELDAGSDDGRQPLVHIDFTGVVVTGRLVTSGERAAPCDAQGRERYRVRPAHTRGQFIAAFGYVACDGSFVTYAPPDADSLVVSYVHESRGPDGVLADRASFTFPLPEAHDGERRFGDVALPPWVRIRGQLSVSLPSDSAPFAHESCGIGRATTPSTAADAPSALTFAIDCAGHFDFEAPPGTYELAYGDVKQSVVADRDVDVVWTTGSPLVLFRGTVASDNPAVGPCGSETAPRLTVAVTPLGASPAEYGVDVCDGSFHGWVAPGSYAAVVRVHDSAALDGSKVVADALDLGPDSPPLHFDVQPRSFRAQLEDVNGDRITSIVARNMTVGDASCWAAIRPGEEGALEASALCSLVGRPLLSWTDTEWRAIGTVEARPGGGFAVATRLVPTDVVVTAKPGTTLRCDGFIVEVASSRSMPVGLLPKLLDGGCTVRAWLTAGDPASIVVHGPRGDESFPLTPTAPASSLHVELAGTPVGAAPIATALRTIHVAASVAGHPLRTVFPAAWTFFINVDQYGSTSSAMTVEMSDDFTITVPADAHQVSLFVTESPNQPGFDVGPAVLGH